MSQISLSEQVVLITGASTGIGAALARLLAQRSSGVRLVLAARNATQLEAVATDCQKAGAEVLTVPTDLSELGQVKALAQKTLERFDRLDILVNNAGYGQMGPLELTIPACEQQYKVNIFGPMALTQAFIPVMRNQGGGRIINISSIGGRIPFPFGGLYSSSKFALESLSDVLRMELEPFNIKVSVIEPGPVATNFFAVVAQQVEAAVPDPESTPYRAAFRKLEDLEKQTSSRAWTSEQAAEVIIKAMTDHKPRPRYVAATSGGILLFLMTKLLPTWMVDKFWQRFYGIDLVMKEWQSRQKP